VQEPEDTQFHPPVHMLLPSYNSVALDEGQIDQAETLEDLTGCLHGIGAEGTLHQVGFNDANSLVCFFVGHPIDPAIETKPPIRGLQWCLGLGQHLTARAIGGRAGR